MNTKIFTKVGAVLFVAWGMLHIVGGGVILFGLADGPAAGYASYQKSEGEFAPVAGALLGYFSYLLILISAAVIAIGVLYNWKNSKAGLALNSAILILVEVGLVIFLLLPGFVLVSEASIGLVLAVSAMTASGIACNNEHAN